MKAPLPTPPASHYLSVFPWTLFYLHRRLSYSGFVRHACGIVSSIPAYFLLSLAAWRSFRASLHRFTRRETPTWVVIDIFSTKRCLRTPWSGGLRPSLRRGSPTADLINKVAAFLSDAPIASHGRGGMVMAALVEERLFGTSVAVARARLGLGVEEGNPARSGTACTRCLLYTSPSPRD